MGLGVKERECSYVGTMNNEEVYIRAAASFVGPSDHRGPPGLLFIFHVSFMEVLFVNIPET